MMLLALIRRLVTFSVGIASALLGIHLLSRAVGWFPSTVGAPFTLSADGLSTVANLVAGGLLVVGGIALAVLGIHVRRHPAVFELSFETLQPGGVVSVDRTAIRDLIVRVACDVDGVGSCRVRRLRLRRAQWNVRCELVVRRQALVRDTAAAVRAAVAAELEHQTGIPAGKIDVVSTLASVSRPVLRVVPRPEERRVS